MNDPAGQNERAEELFAKARKAHDAADYRAVRRLAAELFEHAKENGDHVGMARGHNLLGNAFLHATADGESAERYYRSALEHYRLAADRRGQAIVSLNLGSLALDIYLDLQEARRYYEESLPIFRELEDRELIGFGLSNLAEISRLEGDYAQAYEYGCASLEIFRRLGDDTRVGWQLVNIAHYHLLRGEYLEAVDMLHQSFEYLTREPNPDQISNYFETWFYLAVEVQAHTEAARLLGFLEEYRQRHHVPRLALLMPWFSPRLEKLQRRIPYDEFIALRNEGEGMTLAQADALTRKIEL